MASPMLTSSLATVSRRTPDANRLTVADVVVSALTCLAVVVPSAVVGWFVLHGSLVLYVAAVIVVMVMGVVLARQAPVGPLLALSYSAVLGLMVGGFSFAATSAGGNLVLVVQALVGTVCGVAGMLGLYATRWGRAASKAMRMFAGLALGYLLVSLVSLVASLFGVGGGWGFFGVGVWGLLLCVVGVAMACWSLLIDFGTVDRAVSSGAVGREYRWSLGVSVASACTWVFVELLRLLAIANR